MQAMAGAPVIVPEYKQVDEPAVLIEVAAAKRRQTGVVTRSTCSRPQDIPGGEGFFIVNRDMMQLSLYSASEDFTSPYYDGST